MLLESRVVKHKGHSLNCSMKTRKGGERDWNGKCYRKCLSSKGILLMAKGRYLSLEEIQRTLPSPSIYSREQISPQFWSAMLGT